MAAVTATMVVMVPPHMAVTKADTVAESPTMAEAEAMVAENPTMVNKLFCIPLYFFIFFTKIKFFIPLWNGRIFLIEIFYFNVKIVPLLGGGGYGVTTATITKGTAATAVDTVFFKFFTVFYIY